MHSLLGRVSPSPASPVAAPVAVQAELPPAPVTMLQCVDFVALDRRLHGRLRDWRREEGNALSQRLADVQARPARAKAALARLAGTWAGSLVFGGAWDTCAAGRDALLRIVPAQAGRQLSVTGRLARLEQEAWRLQLAPLALVEALAGGGCTLGALALCLPLAGSGAAVAYLSARLALYGIADAEAAIWLHRVQQMFALEQRFGPWAGLDTWLACAEPLPPPRARGDEAAYA